MPQDLEGCHATSYLQIIHGQALDHQLSMKIRSTRFWIGLSMQLHRIKHHQYDMALGTELPIKVEAARMQSWP